MAAPEPFPPHLALVPSTDAEARLARTLALQQLLTEIVNADRPDAPLPPDSPVIREMVKGVLRLALKAPDILLFGWGDIHIYVEQHRMDAVAASPKEKIR